MNTKNMPKFFVVSTNKTKFYRLESVDFIVKLMLELSVLEPKKIRTDGDSLMPLDWAE